MTTKQLLPGEKVHARNVPDIRGVVTGTTWRPEMEDDYDVTVRLADDAGTWQCKASLIVREVS